MPKLTKEQFAKIANSFIEKENTTIIECFRISKNIDDLVDKYQSKMAVSDVDTSDVFAEILLCAYVSKTAIEHMPNNPIAKDLVRLFNNEYFPKILTDSEKVSDYFEEIASAVNEIKNIGAKENLPPEKGLKKTTIKCIAERVNKIVEGSPFEVANIRYNVGQLVDDYNDLIKNKDFEQANAQLVKIMSGVYFLNQSAKTDGDLTEINSDIRDRILPELLNISPSEVQSIYDDISNAISDLQNAENEIGNGQFVPNFQNSFAVKADGDNEKIEVNNGVLAVDNSDREHIEGIENEFSTEENKVKNGKSFENEIKNQMPEINKK